LNDKQRQDQSPVSGEDQQFRVHLFRQKVGTVLQHNLNRAKMDGAKAFRVYGAYEAQFSAGGRAMPGGYQVPLIGGASLPAPQETVARVGCERLQNTKDATDAKALLEIRSLFDHKSSQSHSKDGEFRECDALCRSTFAHLAKILHGLASCFSSGHTAPVVCLPLIIVTAAQIKNRGTRVQQAM